ncbi:hypothetical protein Poli38472_000720 [Pythium oligandrum]|uniref:Uncharacterized protein n=1 Tax=Pythium oligandrum TaxID=41045 RepID=A0A8K1CCV5_PYTOL|nr:hypothetical protein Poli38472_000720 [Pythium oligandrum]|eukprot:TMW60678.1 hypothetical protein Poli38472_000720 [Pythium oligandrum]
MAPSKHLKEEEKKTVEYFARCLADAIKEFAETDTTSYEDKDKFDPHRYTVWGVEYDTGRGAYAGYYDSLLEGYVRLNILLLDPDTWQHVVLSENGRWSAVMELLCGLHDGGHPEWLANHLRPIFDERGYLKPVTAEVVEVMREHAKLLFRCLYSIGGPVNRAFDWEFVKDFMMIESFSVEVASKNMTLWYELPSLSTSSTAKPALREGGNSVEQDNVLLVQEHHQADVLLFSLVLLFLVSSYLICRYCRCRRRLRTGSLGYPGQGYTQYKTNVRGQEKKRGSSKRAAVLVSEMEEPFLGQADYAQPPAYERSPPAYDYLPSAPPLSDDYAPHSP